MRRSSGFEFGSEFTLPRGDRKRHAIQQACPENVLRQRSGPFMRGSINGTALAASNITPSTGWGTTGAAGNGVSAVSGATVSESFTITAAGTPGASPTIEAVSKHLGQDVSLRTKNSGAFGTASFEISADARLRVRQPQRRGRPR